MPYFTNRGITPLPSAPPAGVTWNPLDKSANITLSGGDLVATCTSSTNSCVRATVSASSGKYYFEITIGVNTNFQAIGIGNASFSLNGHPGESGNNGIIFGDDGNIYRNGGSVFSGLASAGTNDVLGLAVDLTALKLWARVNNGQWNNDNTNHDPATGLGGIGLAALVGGPYFPANNIVASGDTQTVNFGATTYANAAPSGFLNWT